MSGTSKQKSGAQGKLCARCPFRATDANDPDALLAGMRRCIDAVALIEALERHIIHGAEMTTTQVNAALALLKKTLPDMQAGKPPCAGAKDGGANRDKTLSHEEALKLLE